MANNRMCFKIISCLLIQSFIAWDLCWAAGTGPIQLSKTTLAPAVSINRLDLQAMFSFNNANEVLDEEGNEGWGDLENLDEGADHMALSSSLPITGGNAAMGSAVNGGMGVEFVLPPPPDSTFFSMLTLSGFRNYIPFYPFNKKELEEQVKNYGFTLDSQEMDRKLIAYLLQTLELYNGQFVKILQGLNINGVGFKNVITKEGNTKSLEIENGVLYLTPEFLNDRLAVRVSKLNDAISNAVSVGTTLIEYRDYDGEVKMATSESLGLPKEGDAMLQEMRKIAAGYTYPPYWYGFKKFVPYKTDDPSEFMKLMRPKGSSQYVYEPTAIGVSLKILPDLIRLYTIAPKLWRELVEAILAHEGGKRGHLKLWPFTSFEELKKYFPWKTWTKSQAEQLIKQLVEEKWPLDLIVKEGLPAATLWLPAVAILNMSLSESNFDNNRPEPDGVIWKEYQANYGMVKEKGLRAVALWYWWLEHFRKLNNINFNQDLDQRFAFLSPNEITKVFSIKSAIQREYETIVNEKDSKSSGLTSSSIMTGIGVGLLGLMLSAPTFVQASTNDMINVGSANADTFSLLTSLGVAAGIGFAAWLIVKGVWWSKTPEQRTVQLVNQAIRTGDTTKLRNFYQQANLAERSSIISAMGRELNARQQRVEVFEPIFRDALETSPRHIAQGIYDRVNNAVNSQMNGTLDKNNPVMVAVVRQALTDYNKQKNSASPIRVDKDLVSKLSWILMVLAGKNKLDDQNAFITEVRSRLLPIAREYEIPIYNALINQLPVARGINKNTVISIISEELVSYGLTRQSAEQAALEVAPQITISLASLDRQAKLNTFGVFLKHVSPALMESGIGNGTLQSFGESIVPVLINKLALQAAFSGILNEITLELEKSGVPDNQGLVLALLSAMAAIDPGKAKTDDVRTGAFQNLVAGLNVPVNELRFASAQALNDLSKHNYGTKSLVDYVNHYMERRDISVAIREELASLVANLAGVVNNTNNTEALPSEEPAQKKNTFPENPVTIADFPAPEAARLGMNVLAQLIESAI